MKKLLPFFTIIFLLSASNIFAGNDSYRPGGTYSAACATGGTTIKAGTFSVADSFVVGESNGRRHYGYHYDDSQDTKSYNNLLKLRYGIIDGLDVRTITPFYSARTDKATGSDRTNYGVGDTGVLFDIRMLNQDKGDPIYLAFHLGGYVPTGSVGEHSINAMGDAAWGEIASIGATYFFGHNRLDMDIRYDMWEEGAKNWERGDRFRLGQHYAYALSENWDIGIESLFEHDQETKSHGVGQNDSCTEWYVGPKIAYKIKEYNMSVGFVPMFPVYRWYESPKSSNDIKMQLTVKKSFDIGTIFD